MTLEIQNAKFHLRAYCYDICVSCSSLNNEHIVQNMNLLLRSKSFPENAHLKCINTFLLPYTILTQGHHEKNVQHRGKKLTHSEPL